MQPVVRLEDHSSIGLIILQCTLLSFNLHMLRPFECPYSTALETTCTIRRAEYEVIRVGGAGLVPQLLTLHHNCTAFVMISTVEALLKKFGDSFQWKNFFVVLLLRERFQSCRTSCLDKLEIIIVPRNQTFI